MVDWHDRFSRQAKWTLELRRYIFQRIGYQSTDRIIEVGCGTGVLIAELSDQIHTHVYGLDINPDFLRACIHQIPNAHLTLADAHAQPFLSNTFDICYCHFLLLWVTDPIRVVAEMIRVTKPGGSVLAIAEPDYGGRIDYPSELTQVGQWQQAALRKQGADPEMGRRLAGIFSNLGLSQIETGVIGGQWNSSALPEDWESEWSVVEADLRHTKYTPAISRRLKILKTIDKSAWLKGERVLYVPTFYAWGKVTK